MNVLIFDDEKDRCEETKASIEASDYKGLKLDTIFGNDCLTAIKSIFKYVRACLKDPDACGTLDIPKIKGIDLAVIDNNLTHLDLEETRLTAEAISGYIRAFSDIPYVVSINKNSDVDFDLRYLVGDYSTRADIALNAGHLSQHSLWTGRPSERQNSFSPWYWPILANSPARRRQQISAIRGKLGKSIFETLGIPSSIVDVLSRHAKGALSLKVQDSDSSSIEQVTFLDFFESCDRTLPIDEDRRSLIVAHLRGSKAAEEILLRVVSADLDYWFRRHLVGPQEALVDVPHLLMRMPFLLDAGADSVARWQDAVFAHAEPYGMSNDLVAKYVRPNQFKLSNIWCKSPCFWWPGLRDIQELNELFGKMKQPWAEVVFCEDTSQFVPASSSGDAGPKEFVADTEGPWSRRYVEQVPDYKYTPRSRFAL